MHDLWHLLVAPMTTTAPLSTTPSMSARRVDTTDANTWSPPLLLEERAGTRPSNSSRKMIDGARLAACMGCRRYFSSMMHKHDAYILAQTRTLLATNPRDGHRCYSERCSSLATAAYLGIASAKAKQMLNTASQPGNA